jgi:hypothetical protein
MVAAAQPERRYSLHVAVGTHARGENNVERVFGGRKVPRYIVRSDLRNAGLEM